MKINALKNISLDKFIPRTKSGKITAALTFIALLVVAFQTKSAVQIYAEVLVEKNELKTLQTKMADFQKKRSVYATSKEIFDVDYFLKSIDAYAKINGLTLTTSSLKSKYDNAMQIDISFTRALNAKELYAASYAFAKLGFIETADNSKIVMHVEKFTRDDAVKQLENKEKNQ